MSLRIKQRSAAVCRLWAQPGGGGPVAVLSLPAGTGTAAGALRDLPLQGTRGTAAPRLGRDLQGARAGLSSWEKHWGAAEDWDTGLHLPCWAAPSFAGQSLLSMARSPDKFVHQLSRSSPLPFPTAQLRARAVWQPPPSFLCSGADAQVPLLQPSLALRVSFPLQSPSPQTTPALAEGKALSLPTLPAPFVLHLPRWCLFSLQKSWLGKGKILLLLLLLLKFSLLFRLKYFDFEEVEKNAFFFLGEWKC